MADLEPAAVEPAPPPCLCGHPKVNHANGRERCGIYTNSKQCSCTTYIVQGSSLHEIVNFVIVMEADGKLVDRIDQQLRIDEANQRRHDRIVGMD